MQQLTKEEAGRVTSILNDAVTKLKLLSRVPHTTKEVTALTETATALRLPDVAEDFAQLAQLEHEYREASKHAQKHEAGDAEHVDDAVLRATYKRIAHALQADKRAVSVLPPPESTEAKPSGPAAHAHLHHHNHTHGHLAAGHHHSHSHQHSQSHSGNAISIFSDRLTTLIELAGRKLVTTRHAARDEAVEVANKQARIDNAEREVALLQDELKRQRAARTKALADLDETVGIVRAELVAAARGAETELKTLLQQGVTRTAGIEDGHSKSEIALRASLDKVTAEYKAACDAHVDAEAGLRKRKTRARAEAEAALAEHDAAVAATTAAVEDMRAFIAKEVGPLADLKVYYSKIDAELARIAEEDAEEKERKWREEELPVYKHRWCARKIQRFYRPWKLKKDYLAKMKAKKKG